MNEENSDTIKTIYTVPLSAASGSNKAITHHLSDNDKKQQYSTSLPLYYYNDERVSKIYSLLSTYTYF